MQQPVYVYFSRISWAVVSSSTAAQLLAAADRVPFAGPGLKPLVLCIFTCQCRRHVKARGRLSEKTLARSRARQPTTPILANRGASIVHAHEPNTICPRSDAKKVTSCSSVERIQTPSRVLAGRKMGVTVCPVKSL